MKSHLLAAVLVYALPAPVLAGSAIVYQGPPPAEGLLSASFVYPDVGTATTKVVFELQASARSKAPTRIIGVCLEREDVLACGPTAKIWANPAQTHLTLVPAVWTLTAPRGTNYTMSFVPLDSIGTGDRNTVWDQYDTVVVTASW